MPRPSAHILELAKRGAEVRVRELAQEITNLFRLFPDLRKSFDTDELPVPFLILKGSGRITRTAATTRPVRKRRRMSAAARKRISEAQKARWAAQRKAKG